MEAQWTQPLTLTPTDTDTVDTVTQRLTLIDGDTVNTATVTDLDSYRHIGHSHTDSGYLTDADTMDTSTSTDPDRYRH